MSEEIKEVEIPPTAHVSCPLRGHHLIAAMRCDGCEFFAGLTDALSNDAAPFEIRFRVRCASPIDRQLNHVEVDA